MTDRRESPEPQSDSTAAPSDTEAGVESWLIQLLACPVDLARVRLVGSELVCDACGRRYPIRDGIPVMIPEEPEIERKF
jgi:hypothetical protein